MHRARGSRHLSELRLGATDVDEVIAAVRHGVVMVGTTGRVVCLNAAADRILTSDDGICHGATGIAASHPATNRRLQQSIATALAADRSTCRSADSFGCHRPSGKRAYVIHVLPFVTRSADLPARALVLVVDPEIDPEPPTDLLKRVFGLTAAEAEVATRVTRGSGLAVIADQLAISRATVNTHLQHVFDKTDTHRQAELVRLLLTIVP